MGNIIKIMPIGKKYTYQIHHKQGVKISRLKYKTVAEAQAAAVQVCDVFYIGPIDNIEVENEKE